MGLIREYTRKDGTTTFHAEIRLRGFEPQRASFRTKTLAKQWMQSTEASMRDGRHVHIAESKKHTVTDLIDRFITQWLVKYPDRQKKQSALLTWWKLRIGHLKLSDLKPAIIAAARDTLLSEQSKRGRLRNPSTVNRYLAALSKAFTVAVQEWGWLDDSPMRKISKPKEGQSRERFLSQEEKDRLLKACSNSPNPHLYPLVSLSILTAMRYSELINLNWADVDFESRKITLRETKNGDIRVLPLASGAEAILKQCQTYSITPQGLIFVSHRPNNRKGVVTVRGAFAKALKEAGIAGFRWHDLRHTAASYIAMSGATQGELMAILGHRSPHMTRRYAHYSQQHISNVLERSSLMFEKGV